MAVSRSGPAGHLGRGDVVGVRVQSLGGVLPWREPLGFPGWYIWSLLAPVVKNLKVVGGKVFNMVEENEVSVRRLYKQSWVQ